MSTHEFVPCYGAIPFRAFRDPNLAGLPLALLGVIAAHDRFGRNGQGCWASQGRMAELLGCSRQALNEAVKVLLGGEDENGDIWPTYIECGVCTTDRRRQTYKVLYDPVVDNEAFASRKRGAMQRRDRSKLRRRQTTDIETTCRPQTTVSEPICQPESTDLSNEKPPETPVNTGPPEATSQAEYIPLKAGIDRAKARSPQGEWGCGARSGHGGEWWRNVGPERTRGLIRDTLHGMGENRHRPRVTSHG